MAPARTNTFRSRHRLAHDRQFKAVYQGGVRKQRGPLIVTTLPNALDPAHPRLGLSIGVRVGPATTRNRCKRLIREAFRLDQRRFPASASGGYDIVVAVRAARADAAHPRDRLPTLSELRELLLDLVIQADAEWRRKSRRAAAGSDHGP